MNKPVDEPDDSPTHADEEQHHSSERDRQLPDKTPAERLREFLDKSAGEDGDDTDVAQESEAAPEADVAEAGEDELPSSDDVDKYLIPEKYSDAPGGRPAERLRDFLEGRYPKDAVDTPPEDIDHQAESDTTADADENADELPSSEDVDRYLIPEKDSDLPGGRPAERLRDFLDKRFAAGSDDNPADDVEGDAGEKEI